MLNKKGASWIAYTLAVMFFSGMALMIVLWGRGHTQEQTEAAVNYASGRLDCQEVKLDAEVDYSGAPTCVITVRNKGGLNADQILMRYGDQQVELDELKIVQLMPDGLTQNIEWYGNVSFLPVLFVGEDKIGCRDRELKAECR